MLIRETMSTLQKQSKNFSQPGLLLFYQLEKVDGMPYKVKTLYNILASFNRYFKRVRDVDLINDSSFKQFRSAFDGLLRELP